MSAKLRHLEAVHPPLKVFEVLGDGRPVNCRLVQLKMGQPPLKGHQAARAKPNNGRHYCKGGHRKSAFRMLSKIFDCHTSHAERTTGSETFFSMTRRGGPDISTTAALSSRSYFSCPDLTTTACSNVTLLGAVFDGSTVFVCDVFGLGFNKKGASHV